MPMKLSELHVGDHAEIISLASQPLVRRRLMDLGMIRGTTVQVLRVAPLGDPVEVSCKGVFLTLRKSEADGISVRPLGEGGGSMQPAGSHGFGGRRRRFHGR